MIFRRQTHILRLSYLLGGPWYGYISVSEAFLMNLSKYLTQVPKRTFFLFVTNKVQQIKSSEITSRTIVYSIIHSGAYQRKHHSSASLAFVRGFHRSPVNYPHIGPITRKMFPFDDVIMITWDNADILPVGSLGPDFSEIFYRTLESFLQYNAFKMCSKYRYWYEFDISQ